VALLKDLNLESGLYAHNAYHRISEVSGSKTQIRIDVLAYASQDKYTNGGTPIDIAKSYSFVPDIADNAPNFIKQGYLYLKTLPEFANAEDC
jgi:hypothetical protein